MTFYKKLIEKKHFFEKIVSFFHFLENLCVIMEKTVYTFARLVILQNNL